MNKRDALLDLCHALGEPHRDLVLSAEGNVSMRLDDHTMAIKASGRRASPTLSAWVVLVPHLL